MYPKYSFLYMYMYIRCTGVCVYTFDLAAHFCDLSYFIRVIRELACSIDKSFIMIK